MPTSPSTAALRDELLALNAAGADELQRSALAANALGARLCRRGAESARAQPAVARPRARDRRARPDRAPSARCSSADGLHDPAAQRRAAGRAQRHRRGVRPAQPRRRRRRPRRAAGAGLSRRLFGAPARRAAVLNLGGIANLTLLARRRLDGRLRLRAGQCADGRLGCAAPRRGPSTPPALGGVRHGRSRRCCGRCWREPYFALRRPRAPGATSSMPTG